MSRFPQATFLYMYKVAVGDQWNVLPLHAVGSSGWLAHICIYAECTFYRHYRQLTFQQQIHCRILSWTCMRIRWIQWLLQGI